MSQEEGDVSTNLKPHISLSFNGQCETGLISTGYRGRSIVNNGKSLLASRGRQTVVQSNHFEC